MRKCPHCMKTISETAKKCKFCWNWIYEKRDIVDNQSDEEQNVANLENVNSNKELIMAIIWGILLIIACIKLGYILWWVILLVAWIFLTMPYYIERVSKK